MEKKETIKQILNAIKLDVENIDKFEKDVDAVLGMFNEIKDVDVNNVSASLHKKTVKLTDLRADEPQNWNFRPELRGKYFKVPNVSKR